MEKTFHYFAFGSNLLRQRLQINNPSAKFLDIAKLQNYRLLFKTTTDQTSSRWRGGGATIEPSLDGEVWGTVWELSERDKDSLDIQEASYDPINVDVTTQNDKMYTCRTYVMRPSLIKSHLDGRPSPHYKDVIVKGALQSNLPASYIEDLRNIEDNGFNGELPLYNEVMDLLKSSNET